LLKTYINSYCHCAGRTTTGQQKDDRTTAIKSHLALCQKRISDGNQSENSPMKSTAQANAD